MRQLFPPIEMKVEPLELYQGEWLRDAFERAGERFIPSNVILDKTITGIGATSMELESGRDSIILEPTVPVIEMKVRNNPFLAVYEGCKWENVKSYLSDDNMKPKKLLSTPESFWKIKKACQELGRDMYGSFFCLFDECEKLTQDIDYREKIAKPMQDFFQFSGKAFVSATPLEVSDPCFAGFRKIKIVPQYGYKEELRLITTNRYYDDVKNYLLGDLKDSPRIFLFLNTTNGIEKLVEYLGIKKESKIFCSAKSVEKLKKRGFRDVESLYQEPLKKYNFFTCRFYSAFDINLDEMPDVVLLTDLYEAAHTMIDPYTEAVQVQGRFRKRFENGKRFQSLTHIANTRALEIKTEEQLDAELETSQKIYQHLLAEYDKEEDKHKRQVIKRNMERINFAEYTNMDDKGNVEIDYFSIDNLYNGELVKSYYNDAQSLKAAYEGCGYFNVAHENHWYIGGDGDRYELKRKGLPFEKRCKIVLRILEQNPNGLKEEVRDFFLETSDFQLICDVYFEIGMDIFEKKKYQRAELMKELDKCRNEKKRFCLELLDLIHEEFKLGEVYTMDEIQEKLQGFYDRFGITVKVKKNTVEDYYEVSPSYYKPPYTYRLNAIKEIKAGE